MCDDGRGRGGIAARDGANDQPVGGERTNANHLTSIHAPACCRLQVLVLYCLSAQRELLTVTEQARLRLWQWQAGSSTPAAELERLESLRQFASSGSYCEAPLPIFTANRKRWSPRCRCCFTQVPRLRLIPHDSNCESEVQFPTHCL